MLKFECLLILSKYTIQGILSIVEKCHGNNFRSTIGSLRYGCTFQYRYKDLQSCHQEFWTYQFEDNSLFSETFNTEK